MNNNQKKLIKSFVYAIIISSIVCSLYFVHYINKMKVKTKNLETFQSGTVLEEKEYSGDIENQIETALQMAKENPEDAKTFHNLGLLYEKKGLTNMALAQWERAAALDPDNMDYLNDLGRGYFFSGDYNEALKIFKTINDKDAKPKYKVNLAYTYFKLGKYAKSRVLLSNLKDNTTDNYLINGYIANTYIEENNLNAALKYLEKTKKNNPAIASTYFNAGVIYTKLKAYDKAIQEFNNSYNADKTDSRPLLELGKVYILNGNNDKAIESLLYVSKNGDLASASKAYNLLGKLYYKEGKMSEAIQAFKDSTIAYSSNFDAYKNLGNLFYDIGQIKKSIQFLERAHNLNPGDYNLKYNLGNAYYDNRDYLKAIEMWDYALNKGITDPYFNYKASVAYYQTNQLEPAIKLIKKALRNDLYNIDYREHLGNIYLALGKFDLAIKEFNQCLEAEPERAHIYYRVGKAYYSYGNIKNALEFLHKATVNDSSNIEAHDLLGRIYFDRGGENQAIAHWRKAADINPNYINGRSGKAKEHLRKNEFKDAIEELKVLLAIDPENTAFRYDLATCYKNSGDVYKAILQLKNILQIEPDSIKARKTLAEYLIESGNQSEAISNYKLLISKEPENIDLKVKLADIYMASNKFNEAIELYKKALSNNMKNPEVLLKLGIALKLSGNNLSAVKAFKKVIEINPDSSQGNKAKGLLKDLSSEGTGNSSVENTSVANSSDDKYKILINEGNKLYNAKDYEKASEKFREAIELNKNKKEAYYNLGEALDALGKKEEASKMFQIYLNKVTIE